MPLAQSFAKAHSAPQVVAACVRLNVWSARRRRGRGVGQRIAGDSLNAEDEGAPTLGELQSRAIHASWWTAVQATAGAPLAFLANLVVARSLGPHGFGLVASYMAAFGIIVTVLNGGVSDATIQWGAAFYSRGEREALVALTRRCAGYHILVEGPLGAAAAVLLLRHEPVIVRVVGAIAVALTMALGTAVVMVTATSRTSVLAKQALLIGVALQASVMLAAIRTHDPGWVWAVRLAVGTTTVVLPIMSLPRDLRLAVLRPLPPRAWPSGFAAFSARTLVAGLVASLVFSRCEVLVLDAYGLLGQAGLFALAAGIAGQITAPVDAMLGPLIPAAASLIATRREQAALAITRGVRLSGMVTVPLLAAVVPGLTLLMPAIYGGRYLQVGVLFISLGIVSCLQSVLHPVTAFVGALRVPMTVLAFNLAALVVDLALVGALAPALGALAAVIANTAGQVVSLALSIELLRRRLQIPLRQILDGLRALALVAAVVVVSVVVAKALPVGTLAEAFIAEGFALMGAWLAVRACGGLIQKSDLEALSAALPPRLRIALNFAVRLKLVR